MAKKTTVVNEVASALGAAAARVENLKPKRATAKHTKARPAMQSVATPAAHAAPAMSETEEIALVAYLYSEARGFQGGSPEEDWLRAELEVSARRG